MQLFRLRDLFFGAALPAALALCTIQPGMAQGTARASTWMTLGTMAGGIPNGKRSQPANLLLSGDQTILVDAGDGAAEQLAKIGVPLTQIHTIFISHLHYDHVGGVLAILGLRYQINSPGVVKIYGPSGTKRFVDGLLQAMQPESESGNGIPGPPGRPPSDGVAVIEITDGSKVTVGNVAVTAATNTHYSYPPGSPEFSKYQSLSYRFDMPDRSIVFTGDTGPSPNVERLARGADLLVSEVVDPEAALATVTKLIPNLPAAALAGMRQHMMEQHLTPEQVAQLARSANVKKLILTHLGLREDGADQARAIISATYKGPVIVANDLDSF
jgi:ribonuclease BN (tRNA processing enzyme)